MELYTGTKTIKAKPMDLGTYNIFKGWVMPEGEDPKAPGYLVGYPDAKGNFDNTDALGDCHHLSWSPKDVFEASYFKYAPDYEERVVAEKKELDTKLTRLVDFTDSETFHNLESIDSELLMDQMKAMQNYTEVLCARIERFK